MDKSLAQIRNVRTNSLEAAAGILRISTLPNQVYLELTRKCDLRCFMCPRTCAGLGAGGLDMGMNLLRTIERDLFGTAIIVSLNGLGDSPLMGAWHEVLRTVGRYRLHPLLVTNGQNLDYRTIEFFARREGILRLSVDAASPGLYRRLRGGASFDRLLESLAMARRILTRKSGTGMALEFITVLSTENAAETGSVLELAGRYGAQSVHMQHIVALNGRIAAYSLSGRPEEANRTIWTARVLARRLGLTLVAPDFFETEGAEDMRAFFPGGKQLTASDRIMEENHYGFPKTCIEAWNTVFIEVDGTVKPCCASEAKMGNLNETPFAEIWNGPGYQNLRGQLAGKLPLTDSSCSRCFAVFSNRTDALLRSQPARGKGPPAFPAADRHPTS